MKGNVMPSMIQVEPDLLKNLVEVKETIATGFQKTLAPKRFGVVDLWNIRRNATTARGRFKG